MLKPGQSPTGEFPDHSRSSLTLGQSLKEQIRDPSAYPLGGPIQDILAQAARTEQLQIWGLTKASRSAPASESEPPGARAASRRRTSSCTFKPRTACGRAADLLFSGDASRSLPTEAGLVPGAHGQSQLRVQRDRGGAEQGQ